MRIESMTKTESFSAIHPTIRSPLWEYFLNGAGPSHHTPGRSWTATAHVRAEFALAAADWGVAAGEQAVREALGIAAACKVRSIRTVFHPLAYPLTGGNPGRTLAVLRRLAAAADLGIIIHDEGGKGRRRLSAAEANEYANSVKELSGLCHVSIENSFNSGDITWFWEHFVVPAPDSVSLTLAIGHLELACLTRSCSSRTCHSLSSNAPGSCICITTTRRAGRRSRTTSRSFRGAVSSRRSGSC